MWNTAIRTEILVVGIDETWWSMQNHAECRVRKYHVYIVYWNLLYFMESKMMWDCQFYYFSDLHSFMPYCHPSILTAVMLHYLVHGDPCQCYWRVLFQPLNWSNHTLEQRVLIYSLMLSCQDKVRSFSLPIFWICCYGWHFCHCFLTILKLRHHYH